MSSTSESGASFDYHITVIHIFLSAESLPSRLHRDFSGVPEPPAFPMATLWFKVVVLASPADPELLGPLAPGRGSCAEEALLNVFHFTK